MRDTVRNKERCKRRRTPTQDPSTDLTADAQLLDGDADESVDSDDDDWGDDLNINLGF